MQNCKTLRQPLLGELATSKERERAEEEKKMPFIIATYVYASSQGSARTPLGPKQSNSTAPPPSMAHNSVTLFKSCSPQRIPCTITLGRSEELIKYIYKNKGGSNEYQTCLLVGFCHNLGQFNSTLGWYYYRQKNHHTTTTTPPHPM